MPPSGVKSPAISTHDDTTLDPLVQSATSRYWHATPCRAPARNQYWMPICATNGVKLATLTAMPTLAAQITAAHAATLGCPVTPASRYSARTVATSAPP